jgi:Mn-dependent DtxR family transcriptional regulator
MNVRTEVFRKIKDLSRKTLNSRHRIFLVDIAGELAISMKLLLVSLSELEHTGLIKIHKTTVTSVSLTGQGISQEMPLS